MASLTATDYGGIERWVTKDFPETFEFTLGNAPVSIQPLLGRVRDVFAGVYVSRLSARKRGIRSPFGEALVIPPSRESGAPEHRADLTALLQPFLDDQLRAEAEELLSFSGNIGKVFPLFCLPIFAARNALLFTQSANRAELLGLRPLLDAVCVGSMMVSSTCGREEGGDTHLLAERFRSVLGDGLDSVEGGASVAEAERLSWTEPASLARKCLIGYPFRARTVVGFLFLEWFDIANWRLALLALQGALTVTEADRAFIQA